MSWFKVEKLPDNIYAIMEPYHFQEVISYLIIGKDAALLLDTGAGICKITEVINHIWSGPIVVINSHTHFDHVGSNHCFDEVLVFDHPHAISRLKRGYTVAELGPHNISRLFVEGYFGKFGRHDYCILPCNPVPIYDKHVVDLGGRKISIMHTPGHSPDSIVLIDENTNSLFTGDTYYPGPLYAHYKGSFYGESCLADYASSMSKLALLHDVHNVHPGHNMATTDFNAIKNAAQALNFLNSSDSTQCQRVLVEDLTIASLPSDGQEVEGYIIPDPLYMYECFGVKVILG